MRLLFCAAFTSACCRAFNHAATATDAWVFNAAHTSHCGGNVVRRRCGEGAAKRCVFFCGSEQCVDRRARASSHTRYFSVQQVRLSFRWGRACVLLLAAPHTHARVARVARPQHKKCPAPANRAAHTPTRSRLTQHRCSLLITPSLQREPCHKKVGAARRAERRQLSFLPSRPPRAAAPPAGDLGVSVAACRPKQAGIAAAGRPRARRRRRRRSHASPAAAPDRWRE